jgi:hypothetical protein
LVAIVLLTPEGTEAGSFLLRMPAFSTRECVPVA